MDIGYLVYQTKHGFIQSLYIDTIADKLSDEADIILENMEEKDMPKQLAELTGDTLYNILNTLNIKNSNNIKIILNNQDEESILPYLNESQIQKLNKKKNNFIIYYTDWM